MAPNRVCCIHIFSLTNCPHSLLQDAMKDLLCDIMLSIMVVNAMRKINKYILAGVALPAVFLGTLYSQANTSERNQSVVGRDESRPYLIEVFAPNGEKASTARGNSLAKTPFFVAVDLGIKPHEKDRFEMFPPIEMSLGGKITLYETPAYEITDGRKKLTARSWAKTVGELLAENKLEIGVDDKINFSPDTVLVPGMKIIIIRVAKTTVFETEPINFKTIKTDDPTLDQGKTRVTERGQKGERRYAYEVTREDGVEVLRVLKKTEVTREPVTERVLVGTKPAIHTACRFNDTVIAAAIKHNLDPNSLCIRMMKESRGNPNSDGGQWKGLFQYEEGLWQSVSAKAGYAGASIWDPEAQIHVTAWAWTHGYRGRWPGS